MVWRLSGRFAPLYDSKAARQVEAWRITRTDGVVFRYTNHDQPLWIGDEEFKPSRPISAQDPLNPDGGLEGYALQGEGGLGEHSSAIEGLLAGDDITVNDLVSGIFQGATVERIRCDARLPAAGEFTRTYKIAQLGIDSTGRWRADLVSAVSSALSERRGDVVSEDCRNNLFDEQCSLPRTIGGADGLVKDRWQVGLAAGNYCRVRSIGNARTFTVSVPSIEITDLEGWVSGGINNTGLTMSELHYLCGLNPAHLDETEVRIGIRGNVGHVPGINGTYTQAICRTPDPGRFMRLSDVETVTPGTTFGRVGFEPPAGWFVRGLLTWKSGSNSGVEQIIEFSSDFMVEEGSDTNGYVQLVLEDAPSLPIQIGDEVSLLTGCDGQRPTCVEKFANLINMRAEPTVADVAEALKSPVVR